MKKIRYLTITMLAAVALFALLPVSMFAASKKVSPIVVTINDVPNGAPVIQVQGAPHGYDINTVLPNDPAIEDGALITLFGVDQGGPIADWEGRFVVPTAPNPARTAVDIVWVEHDFDNFGDGDLRVGFNSAFAGTYYGTKNSLGLVTDNWVEVYTSDILVVRFKPHTYRLTVARPLKETGMISFTPTSDFGGTFGVVGTATHLGKFVGSGTYEVTGLSPDGLKVYFHVTATWTASNGDSIKIDCPEWVNDASITPPTSTGVMKIIGGTGRFADASGSFFSTISPAAITPGVPNTLTGEGNISY